MLITLAGTVPTPTTENENAVFQKAPVVAFPCSILGGGTWEGGRGMGDGGMGDGWDGGRVGWGTGGMGDGWDGGRVGWGTGMYGMGDGDVFMRFTFT
ncbi:hypothetical protein DESC_780322 [Desulfosarcina cetonica]|nr:hypothetical protein DESC_780322 [Desulfosarcina cetonica]